MPTPWRPESRNGLNRAVKDSKAVVHNPLVLFRKLEPLNCRALLEPLSCRSGKLIVQVTSSASGCWSVAGHTGQSSQLFPVATGRNAQFHPAVASMSS
jgi:hypothetical protein